MVVSYEAIIEGSSDHGQSIYRDALQRLMQRAEHNGTKCDKEATREGWHCRCLLFV